MKSKHPYLTQQEEDYAKSIKKLTVISWIVFAIAFLAIGFAIGLRVP